MLVTSFPDRPDHDDFWLMAEIVQDLNTAGDDGVDLSRIVSDIDAASLVYMAVQRTRRSQDVLTSMNPVPDLEVFLSGLWIEGFKAGVEFQKRRGRR